MNIIIYLIAGALVGWVASIIMRTNGQQGLLQDIIVGVVGAFIAGFFLSPVFGVAPISVGGSFQHAGSAGVAGRRHHPAGDRQTLPPALRGEGPATCPVWAVNR